MKKMLNIIGAAVVILLAGGWAANEMVRAPGELGQHEGLIVSFYKHATIENYDTIIKYGEKLDQVSRIAAEILIFGDHLESEGALAPEINDRIRTDLLYAKMAAAELYKSFLNMGCTNLGNPDDDIGKLINSHLNESGFSRRARRGAKDGLVFLAGVEEKLKAFVKNL